MTYTLLHNDAITALRELSDNSVDAVVCDPPYDLVSINKRFSSPDAAPAQYGRDGAFARLSKGFMGKEWDGTGIAFKVETWAEVMRVLKPGGHLLAFGGTRTYHRMACAIEDAGFEIRDSLHWIYGSGFPKSHDISKAIDRMAGAEREVISTRTKRAGDFRGGQYDKGGDYPDIDLDITAPATDAAKQWQGWGTALKPSHEPIVMARKPIAAPNVASNVLAWGTGALNIDQCRISTADNLNGGTYSKGASNGTVYGGGLVKPANREYEPPAGRWPPNLVLSHADDCERVGVRKVKGQNATSRGGNRSLAFAMGEQHEGVVLGYADADGLEAVEEYRCVDGCPVQVLGQQSGERVGTHGGGKAHQRPADQRGTGWAMGASGGFARDDTGTAARFFPCFQVDEYDTFPYNSRNVWEANTCPAKQAHGDNTARVTADGIATGENQEAENYTANLSTDGYGSKHTAQSLMDATSTISTTTNPTTGSKTSHVSPQNSTTTITSGYESGTSSEQTASSGDNANDVSDTSRLTSSASETQEPITDTAKPAPSSMCASGDEPITSATEHTSEHITTHTKSDPSKSPANTVAACSCQHASVVGSAPSLAETKPHTTEQNSFFPTFTPDYDAPFLYQAKASRRERNAGCEGLPEVRSGTGALRQEQGGEYLDFLYPVPEGIGAWLREQREQAGLTLRDVAQHFPSRTGGLTGCVVNWEKEYNRPTPDQWRTLRDVIGFDGRHDEVMTTLKPVPHAVRTEPVAVKNNHHPTVKPISLMRWLVRLVTPPNGTVLDCFMGSGSTGVAAVLEGFSFIGIEREDEYIKIASARIAHADGGVLEIERTVTRRVTVEETERTVVRVKARDLQLALWEDA